MHPALCPLVFFSLALLRGRRGRERWRVKGRRKAGGEGQMNESE